MDLTTGIALTALVVSLITGGVQVATWWSARHRVKVTCHTATVGVPRPDGATVNHTLVYLTVRNIGRAVAVDNVAFEEVNGTNDGQGLTWGTPTAEALRLISFRPLPSRFTPSALIPDGGSETWVFTLNVSPPDPAGNTGFEAVARVDLSTGKSVSSDPFWHIQTPPSGWVPPAAEGL